MHNYNSGLTVQKHKCYLTVCKVKSLRESLHSMDVGLVGFRVRVSVKIKVRLRFMCQGSDV